MEDLAENAREVIGKEEVDTEAQVVVAPVMITSGEVSNTEDSEDLSSNREDMVVSKEVMAVKEVSVEEVPNSNKEVQAMVVKVVLEVVMEVLQEVTGDDLLYIQILKNKV